MKRLLFFSIAWCLLYGTANTFAQEKTNFETGVPEENIDPSIGMKFVYVKGGCYQMGDIVGNGNNDEKPVHEVCVDDLYMGKYEVKVSEYQLFVSDTGYLTDAEKNKFCLAGWKNLKQTLTWGHWSFSKPGFDQTDNHPAVCISWNDAWAFTEWLSRKSGKRYRLPTEAEWEYAARSYGKKYDYSSVSGKTSGNIADESLRRRFSKRQIEKIWDGYDDGYAFTSPVGSFNPNDIGLYDMSGNSTEWCSDWYDDKYYNHSPRDNPHGPFTGESHVVRGESWVSPVLRVSSRGNGGSSIATNYSSFRVLLSAQDVADTVARPERNKSVIFVQNGHSQGIRSLAFSPDGKYIISGGDESSVKLWDVNSGAEVRTFEGHRLRIASVVFSPDGNYVISGSADGSIKLWDVSTGINIRTFIRNSDLASVNSVAISPDGKYIVSGSFQDSTLKLWDLISGSQVRVFSGHSSEVRSMAFSPDSRFVLSASGDHTIKLWNVITGKEMMTLTGHTDEINSVAISSDGKYAVSGSKDKTVKVWNLLTGKESRSFSGHTGSVTCVALSPEGKYAISGSADKSLKIWDLQGGKEIRTLAGHSSVSSVAFSPDGQYALSGDAPGKFSLGVQDTSIRLWSVNTGQEIKQFTGKLEYTITAALSPKGNFALTGALKLWDLRSGRQIRSFTGHEGLITSIAFSPDEKYVITGSADNTTKLWDIVSGDLIRTFGGKGMGGWKVSFSSNGKFILLGRDRDLSLWDITTGQKIQSFIGHEETIQSVSFSSDGRYAISGSIDHSVKIWDLDSGKEVRAFKGQTGSVEFVAFSQDNKHVILCEIDYSKSGNNYISLWDFKKGKEIKRIKGSNPVLSPEGQFLVFRNENLLKRWDFIKGEEHAIISTEGGPVAFSPNGKHLLVLGTGGLEMLNVTTGKTLAKMINMNDNEWVTITPEGYFDSSDAGTQYVKVRIGNNSFSIDQLYGTFFRPDLVKLSLAGETLHELPTLSNLKVAPKVKIVRIPKTATKEVMAITVRIEDTGGGIGDVRLYLNGSAVVLDNTRGVKVAARDDKVIYKTYSLKLTRGLNTIRAIAFNGDNTMQSSDAIHTITATLNSMAKPSLYALVIGINNFKNPKLKLAYPVADADLFASSLRSSASGMFEQVHIKKLTSAELTNRENIINELKAYRTLKPDDLFVFFVASHGTVDDGEYFLITSNVGSTRIEKLRTDAISQTVFKELIANIPATKKLIIIDTCNAGALGDAIQVAMLTRGMSEDTAMKVLSRAVGSTILSASTSLQEALEGYKGHGLFTYVLTEGLSGKADKSKSGYIKTTELADYVDSEVPALAEKVFKRAQYPTISISGMGFPIGKSK